MEARKGEWFSLTWDIIDFNDKDSYTQFESAPKFLYAENDSRQIESAAINEYYRIRLVRIFITSVFVTDTEGNKVPTHYRIGEFMPGDSVSYDKWLARYHKINFEVTEFVRAKEALNQKNVYLEHSAKIIRHDMHSGINTYIPRGFKSLMRRLPEKIIKENKLETAIKLLKEGIDHAKRVYDGVYAFTNLVKKDSVLEKNNCDLKMIINNYLRGTAYSDQVIVEELIELEVNSSLFCTAIDNLIRNGLKYNDSPTKFVRIYMEDENTICVQDNGRGLSRRDFLYYCKPYIRKINQKESGSGLGLNIAAAIFTEHGFSIDPEEIENGTIMRVKLNAGDKKYIISGR
jgi:signal transduction histidine kinase